MCIAIRIPGRIPKDIVDLSFYSGHPLPVATTGRKIRLVPWGRVRGEVGARLWPLGGWVDNRSARGFCADGTGCASRQGQACRERRA